MRKLYGKAGPVERIPKGPVRILCHSRAPGRIHAGAYIVNGNIWRVDSTMYPPRPHTCHPGERGCVPATQLRALYAAFLTASHGTTFTIHMTSHEAVLLVRQWQAGNLTPPAWFKQTGPNGAWLYKLSKVVAFNPTAMTVKTVDLAQARWGKQMRGIVDALIAHSTIRHPERREVATSCAILPLFSQLPT